MVKSLFALAFDHVDDCTECDYGERRLCANGRALFNAAHDACKLIAGAEIPQTKASA